MVFDPVTGTAAPVDSLVVEEGRFAEAGRGESPGKRELDASGLSILPGLIDLHVHFGAPVGDDLRRPPRLLALDYMRQRPAHRRAFLAAGVTTIRSVGDVVGVGRDILDLRHRAAASPAYGPSVFTTGPLFTAPGGHPAATLYRGNDFLVRNGTRQVDDVGTAVREVEALAPRVDGIKVVYDDVDGRYPRLPIDLMRAIIGRAHELGRWAAVHTRTAADVADAVACGADTIEHGASDGTRLDDSAVRELAARNVTYVPTLVALEALIRDLGADALETPAANALRIVDAGGRVGAGTDAAGPLMSFGGSLHEELELLVRHGFTPVTALRAATSDAAAALRREHDVGRVEPGFTADAVVVEGQPWQEIGAIRGVVAVLRHGVVVAGRLPRVRRRPRSASAG